jgi:hypothetical protein
VAMNLPCVRAARKRGQRPILNPIKMIYGFAGEFDGFHAWHTAILNLPI